MNTQIKLMLVVISLLSAPFASKAAELRSDTLKAWNQYLETENRLISERAHSSPFLWIDESPERQRRVREGEILISPVGVTMPKNVPHGLIHHWIGAAFVPDAHLEDVFAIVRDYSRYKEIYAPNVIDSKPLSQTDSNKAFTMVMLNKALFSKTALDADFRESYVRLNDKQWYGIVYSTRVQEVESYGQPGQHELPPDAGSGYVWRLYSLSRFEERDGGVYVELEAIALSRDVPGSLRWLVNPIVRRVSKGSLLVSLQKTQQAVHSTIEVASRPTSAAEPFSVKRSFLPLKP